MRKALICAMPVLLVTLIAGCTSSYVNQPSFPLDVATKTEVKPVIQVGEKIEATATVCRICYLFTSGPGNFAEGVNYAGPYHEPNISSSMFGDTIAEAKAAAAYKACSENKADFILCPRYYIIVEDYPFFRRTKARVFGYKGVLKGVEMPVEKPEPTVSPVQKILLTNPVKLEQPVKLSQPITVSEPVQQRNMTPVKHIDSSVK